MAEGSSESERVDTVSAPSPSKNTNATKKASNSNYYNYLKTSMTKGNPRFKKIWNQIWDVEYTNSDHENQIVCLGREYDPKVNPVIEQQQADDELEQEQQISPDGYSLLWPPQFLEDVESKIWMTYRKNFPVIPKAKNGPSTVSITGVLRGSGIEFNGFSTDVGWGCMIRTAQSLLANALILLRLGREWRKQTDNDNDESNILKLFIDDPNAPFSLHNFVKHGEEYCGKMPGEWFGPSAAASSIKALSEDYCDDLRVYISSGSDIYENEFLKIAQNDDGDAKGGFKPTLILLGIRLGIDKVNPVYWGTIKGFLNCPQAVGIAGGRPSSSHYFFGYQNDYLFYLDPHQWQPALKLDDDTLTADALETCHTTRIRAINFDEMDPSMLVGFLIKSETDWEEWKSRINSDMLSSSRKIVSISAEPPTLNTRSSVSPMGSDNEDDGDDLVGGDNENEENEDEFIEIIPLSENNKAATTVNTVSSLDDPPVMINSTNTFNHDDTPVLVEGDNLNDSYYYYTANDDDYDNDDSVIPVTAEDEWEIMNKTTPSATTTTTDN